MHIFTLKLTVWIGEDFIFLLSKFSILGLISEFVENQLNFITGVFVITLGLDINFDLIFSPLLSTFNWNYFVDEMLKNEKNTLVIKFYNTFCLIIIIIAKSSLKGL